MDGTLYRMLSHRFSDIDKLAALLPFMLNLVGRSPPRLVTDSLLRTGTYSTVTAANCTSATPPP